MNPVNCFPQRQGRRGRQPVLVDRGEEILGSSIPPIRLKNRPDEIRVDAQQQAGNEVGDAPKPQLTDEEGLYDRRVSIGL